MSRIILINPPWGKQKGNIWHKVASCFPSLGLGYIASSLEKAGHTVKLLDCQANSYSGLQIINEVLKFQPEYAGFTATSVLIKNGLNIAKLIKDNFPEIENIFGGVHSSVLPEEVLKNSFVDIVVRGEGELTILEILENKPLKEILGISYKKGSEIVHNRERPFIKDINIIPFPAYHLMPMERYFSALGSAKRSPAISIFATRGCPGRCTFCYNGIFGNKIRQRSGENIIAEIELLIKNYGIREISFYDDTFTCSKKNVLKFCELIKKKNIDITWSCLSRVDYIDEELLYEMKRAGCHQICYGIESSDSGILKNINKRLFKEKIISTIEKTKKNKIDVRLAFMLGNPGETVRSMEETIKYAIFLDPDLVQFNITTPYPGTVLYKWVKASGYLLTEEWSKYDQYHCVMALPTVSKEEVENYYKLAYKKFFFRPSYILKRLLKIRTFFDLKMTIRSGNSIVSTVFGNKRRVNKIS